MLGVVERPLLDQLLKAVEVGVFEQLVVVAAEVFFVADRAFGLQVEYVVLAEWADGHGQPAEQVVASTGVERQVVAADGGAPALVVDDGLEFKTREIIAKLLEAPFDVVGQIAAVLRVQTFAFFFAHRLGSRFRRFGIACLLATLGRAVQSFFEIHQRRVSF